VKEYFSQLLNIHSTSDVRQIEIHTAEMLVPDRSPLKRYKSPGSSQIPAELILAGGAILRSKIHKLINFIWNKEKLPDQWKESIITAINFIQNCIQYTSLNFMSICRRKYWDSSVWVST
jgi:hypothetical protein